MRLFTHIVRNTRYLLPPYTPQSLTVVREYVQTDAHSRLLSAKTLEKIDVKRRS